MGIKTKKVVEQNIVRLYGDGYGTMVLADMFHVNRATIQRILKSNYVKLRRLTHYYDYDEYFFSHYTKESCYWAGFIAADGCIRSDRDTLHIKLASKDRPHLAKFLNAIGSKNTISDSNENYDYSYINVSGKHYINDLKTNFCITPQKSLTLRFPKHMPIRFTPDFIRGYFDGDGCICMNSSGQVVAVSFVGTAYFLDHLRKYFYYAVGVRSKSRNQFPPLAKAGDNKLISTIAYSGENAIRILNHIYNNSNENNRLDRKYQRYENFVGQNEVI